MEFKSTNYLLGDGMQVAKEEISRSISWNDHKIKFVLNYVKNKTVLDIGCVQHNPENYKSKYWLHKAIVKVAKSVDGVDLYEPGVNYLKALGYNIYLGNAETFNLGKEYDVVVAGDLIEHLNNVGEFLSNCRKHLKSNGVLLVSTPNPWYWKNILKAILHKEVNNNPEHTLWLCPRTLKQISERYGFEIVEWHYGSRYFRDRVMLLPSGIKHTSFHAVLQSNI